MKKQKANMLISNILLSASLYPFGIMQIYTIFFKFDAVVIEKKNLKK